MAKRKNPAAVALGKRRWAGKSKAEKIEQGKRLAAAATEAMTPEQRIARARKAAQARWSKKRKATP